jgi:hypothetical protein
MCFDQERELMFQQIALHALWNAANLRVPSYFGRFIVGNLRLGVQRAESDGCYFKEVLTQRAECAQT